MRPYSHRTNYQRLVISSANDFFFPQSKFSQLLPRPTILCQETKSFVPWQLSFVEPSYFGNMTNWSSLNWDVSGNTKNRVSQMRTRRLKMGDYKIVTFFFVCLFWFCFCFWFAFLANAKLSLLLQCKQGQMRHECRLRCFEFIQNLVLQNYVINTLKTLWRRTNNAFL